MNIEFTKMQGLGNDFVVINAIKQTIDLSDQQVAFIADRRLGIGCDQVLLVEQSNTSNADFRYRIFNADGSEVEQCGNGARCFAKFVRDEKLTDKSEVSVITSNGQLVLRLNPTGDVTVDMGAPVLTPTEIPFDAATQSNRYSLTINNEVHYFGSISMGNPHAVIIVDDIETTKVEHIGKAFQADPRFPNSVNVGFMQVINRHEIKLRVYERGVGETQACGTGACAAVVVGNIQGVLDAQVNTRLLGGQLSIDWAGDENPVMMTGSATTVFTGNITL